MLGQNKVGSMSLQIESRGHLPQSLPGAKAWLALSLAFALAMAAYPANSLAATQPSAGPRRIETLSVEERNSLPDTTQILVINRTVTLGQLRVEHSARMARFANAAKLGVQAKSTFKRPGSPSRSALVPVQLDPLGAADYQAFCQGASGCIYLPGGLSITDSSLVSSGYWPQNNVAPYWNDPDRLVYDIDPLITDSSACTSEGGVLLQYGGGCAYPYPTIYNASFVPGSPPPGKPIGSNVSLSQTTDCQSITLSFDPRGSLGMSFFIFGTGGPAYSGALACSVAITIAGSSS
jgi:hypothetical protein